MTRLYQVQTSTQSLEFSVPTFVVTNSSFFYRRVAKSLVARETTKTRGENEDDEDLTSERHLFTNPWRDSVFSRNLTSSSREEKRAWRRKEWRVARRSDDEVKKKRRAHGWRTIM